MVIHLLNESIIDRRSLSTIRKNTRYNTVEEIFNDGRIKFISNKGIGLSTLVHVNSMLDNLGYDYKNFVER